jgi:hypothetical protein
VAGFSGNADNTFFGSDMPLRLYFDHLDDAHKETKKKWLSTEKVVCCVQLEMLLAAITISSMRVGTWECGSVSNDVKLKHCSKCDATEYCSRECQVMLLPQTTQLILIETLTHPPGMSTIGRWLHGEEGISRNVLPSSQDTQSFVRH